MDSESEDENEENGRPQESGSFSRSDTEVLNFPMENELDQQVLDNDEPQTSKNLEFTENSSIDLKDEKGNVTPTALETTPSNQSLETSPTTVISSVSVSESGDLRIESSSKKLAMISTENDDFSPESVQTEKINQNESKLDETNDQSQVW